MKYHITNVFGEKTVSCKYKGDRDDIAEFWINHYGDDVSLIKKDDTFEEFKADCPSLCFGGCMIDSTHRECCEGICKTWEREHE